MFADIDVFLLLTRWVHILSAIAALGGAIYMRVAVVPGLREGCDEQTRDRLREAFRARWARIVMASIALLLVTGGINFYRLAIAPRIPAMPYHPIFLVKLLAALVIFFLTSALVGRSAGFARYRARSAKWLTVIVVLGVIIVLLSGVLAQVRAG